MFGLFLSFNTGREMIGAVEAGNLDCYCLKITYLSRNFWWMPALVIRGVDKCRISCTLVSVLSS